MGIAVLYSKLNPYANEPLYKTDGAAGVDLSTIESVILQPNQITSINTGIAFEIPYGFYGKISDRSSMALKGTSVKAGIIDSDYRGEIIVLLRNDTSEPIEINANDRIAQIIFQEHQRATLVLRKDLSRSGRSSGGFGSTGV